MQQDKRLRVLVVIVSIIATVTLIDIFTPVWGGQAKYYAKWVECGRRPQQQGGGVGPQYVGFYETSPVFSVWRNNHLQYYCTEKDAEKAGLSSDPNSYEYPHLSDQERRDLHDN